MEPLDSNSLPPKPIPEREMPKKYIRTFAGDMEILKKGGVPDLAPLEPTPREEVEAEPVPDEGKVVPPPAPDVPLPEIKAQQTPDERLVAPSPIPEIVDLPPLTPEPPPAVTPPVPVREEPVVAPLKTYAEDFTDRVKVTEASPVTVLAAEQDAKKGEPIVVEEEPKKSNPLLLIGGIVLLVLALMAIGVAFSQYRAVNTPVEVTPAVQAPITVEERVEVTGEGKALLDAIMQSVATPPPAGSIRFLYSVSTSTAQSLFGLLKLGAPDLLTRNVIKDGSMAGVIHLANASSPFFILHVQSYPETFAAMLSWESTILRDLAPLFPAYESVALGVATSTATSSPKAQTTGVTSTSVTLKSKLTFHDETFQNHDIRVYRDAPGRVVLVYGYWDRSTLVIARDLSVYGELLSRLSTSHPVTP